MVNALSLYKTTWKENTGKNGDNRDTVTDEKILAKSIAENFLPKQESENPKICPTCSSQNFWLSVYGGKFCRDCSPPLDPSMEVATAIPSNPSPVGPAAAPRLTGGAGEGFATQSPQPLANERGASQAIVETFHLPRGIQWPPVVFSLPWPDGLIPDWLETRTEMTHRAQRVGKETTFLPVGWSRPSWILFPDPDWPMPKIRWAPNDLPACWHCGRILFWRDARDDERCALCSPPRDGDEIVAWFLKRGPSLD